MIHISSITNLEEKILSEHPDWSRNSVKNMANEFIMTCDSRLETVIEDYISKDIQNDFSNGEFTVFLIRAIQHDCGFLDAIMLMDAYLKDPLHGKALILRR